MSLDFVAIDFETANGFRGSPCAVGLVKVQAGRVVEEFQTLIRPPAPVRAFDYRNVRIHGIRPSDVTNAPEFSEAAALIEEFAGDLPLAAHNAAFDMGVLRAAAEAAEVPLRGHAYACSVQMSRKTFSLLSHALPFAAEAAGAPMSHHHDALHDARACAAVVLASLSDAGGRDFPSAVAALGVPLSAFHPYDPSEGVSEQTREAIERMRDARGGWVDRPVSEDVDPRPALPPLDEVRPNPEADRGNPLWGKRVLFTGPLGLTRAEAWRRAAQCGAQPAAVLTASTNVLVVGGGFEADDVRQPGGFRSSTLEKVRRLQSRGMEIEIVTEGEFMQCVGGSWPPHGA